MGIYLSTLSLFRLAGPIAFRIRTLEVVSVMHEPRPAPRLWGFSRSGSAKLLYTAFLGLSGYASSFTKYKWNSTPKNSCRN